MSFFTPCPPSIVRASRGGRLLRPTRLFKLPPLRPPPYRSRDRHLLPGPFALRRGATAVGRRLRAAGTDHGASSTRWSDSGRAPRTAAPSPNADGRTTNVPERAASERSCSVRRTSSSSHGASGPKQPPRTTAWTSKRLKVDASAMPSERPASSSARTTSGSPDSARRTSSSVRLRDRPATGGTPAARAIDSWPTNVSTHPRLPHAHSGAVRVDGDVTELAAEAVRPAEEPAAEHDAAADADLAEDADEVVDPDGGARPVLRERGEVRLVLDVDREARAAPRARLRRAGPASPGSGRSTTVPDASSTRPGTRDRDADRAQTRRGRRPRAPSGPRVPAGRAQGRAPSLGCRGTTRRS